MNNLIYYLYCVAVLGVSSVICSSEKNQTEEKTILADTKDKRQIGVYQTAISPDHHAQFNHVNTINTIHGSHPNQFVIQTIEQPLHQLQQQQQQHQQLQQQQQQQRQSHHNIVQQPEQNSETLQQNVYSQRSQDVQEQRYPNNKASRKYVIRKSPAILVPEHLQRPQEQYIQSQFHILSPQDLKFFQQEITARIPSLPNSSSKQSQVKTYIPENNPKQGLGNYRGESESENHQESVPNYTREKLAQPYYAQIPIDYHRSIPNHPLAISSLEKELEKLVASNRPNQQNTQKHQSQQVQVYNAPKQQKQGPATFSTPAATAPISIQSSPEKFFSFFPDIAQLSGFNSNVDSYLNEQQPQEQATKTYHTQNYEQETKYRKPNLQNNPYLIGKQKFIASHQPQLVFQPQQQRQIQLQHSQQTEKSSNIQSQQDHRNSVMKIIEPPSLNYGKSHPIVAYYKNEKPDNFIPLQQKLPAAQPSTSTIFVSQSTGIHSPANTQSSSSVSTKIHNNEEKHTKLPTLSQLPPLDGKPLTQEEFQALVDAGYPVQAVPVPVPVPYEQFVRQSPQQHHVSDKYTKTQNNHHQSPKQSSASNYLHRVNKQTHQQSQHQQYHQQTN